MGQIETAALGVVEALSKYRLNYAANEVELQEALAAALALDGFEYEREKQIPGGRLDFLVKGGIGIEVKIKGAWSSLARQLERYARCEVVSSLVVVTTRIQLARPSLSIQGKPVHFVYAGAMK